MGTSGSGPVIRDSVNQADMEKKLLDRMAEEESKIKPKTEGKSPLEVAKAAIAQRSARTEQKPFSKDKIIENPESGSIIELQKELSAETLKTKEIFAQKFPGGGQAAAGA